MLSNLKKKTSDLSVWNHLAIAIFIIVFLPIIYFAFLEQFIDTEMLSTIGYFIAIIVSSVAIIRAKHKISISLYIVIPLFCLLAFLEEIAYGVELFGGEYFVWDKYNVVIKDIHSLVGFYVELFLTRMRGTDGFSARFFNFLQKDLYFILMLILAFFSTRFQLLSSKSKKLLPIGLPILFFLAGLLLVADMASLAADPKNALLFGFSGTRILLMVAILSLSLMPLILIIIGSKNSKAHKSIQVFMERITQKKTLKYINVLFLLTLTASMVFQVITLINRTEWNRAIFARISPLTFFTLASFTFLWLLANSKNRLFSYSLVEYKDSINRFYRAHPAFIYGSLALALIAIAQSFDLLLLDSTEMRNSGQALIANLGQWSEDGFELTSGFLFISAGYFIGNSQQITRN